MKVQLSKDLKVAPGGHTVEDRKAGDVIAIDDDGGQALVDQKLGKQVDDDIPVTELGGKTVEAAPENKDAGKSLRKTK